MTDEIKFPNFILRQALQQDIPDLANLHAIAWRETYERLDPPADFKWPTAELRERQWQESFNTADGSWFCYVIEIPGQGLIGFAKGKNYDHHDLPDFSGELNKIYLLRKFHHEGLGHKLFNQMVKHFISRGILSMVLFSEPKNPTGKIFEAWGAEKIFAKNGEFKGAYGWKDLSKIATG